MLLVIPSISLHNGKCHFLVKGERGTKQMYLKYSDKPEMLSLLWRRENAKTIHITDFDALNNEDNKLNIEKAIEISDSLDIPVQLLSEFKSIENCFMLLDRGIYRLILYDFAINNSNDTKELLKYYTSSHIAFLVNTYKGQTRFLKSSRTFTDIEYVNYLKELGASRIIFRDEARFDTNEGPDISAIKRICDTSKIKITVYGSVTNPEQLWYLQKYENLGIDSVVIDKPLYQNAFPCQKIWRLIEAELEKG
jgi:phosphoribosylformimino-5-aminoimidazole carboxamide ribotide isomerase